MTDTPDLDRWADDGGPLPEEKTMALDPAGFRRVTNAPTFDCPRCGRESRWDRSRAVAWYTMNCTVCIDCFESMRAEEPAADKPFDGATPRTSDTISHRGKGDHA